MRRHPPPLCCMALGLLAGLLPAGGRATTLLYKGFEDLTLEADAVVVGTVTAVEAALSPNEEIYSYVTLDQLDPVYGVPLSSQVVVRLLGGAFGEDVLEVHGAPQFTVGERVLLFLRGNTLDVVPVVGWTQGVFRPCIDPTSGKEVTCDFAGNRVFEVSGNTITKESLYFPDAEIVEAEDSGAGDTDDGTPTQKVEAPPVPSGLEALEFAGFVQMTRDRIAALSKVPQPIVSAVVGDFANLPLEWSDGPILDPGEIFEEPVEPTEPFLPAAPAADPVPTEGAEEAPAPQS